MKKLFSTVLALCFLVSIAYAQEMKAVSEFEGGKLYKAGKINVLELRGSYRQMGRQYGGLLKGDWEKCYQIAFEKYFIGNNGMTYETLDKIAKDYFRRLPKRLQDLIYGMAETSGISLEKHILLNTLDACAEIWGAYGKLIPGTQGMGCSAIVAWGKYTGGGPLVVGRNYDYLSYFEELLPFMECVVYNPNDGSIPTASFAFLGAVYTQNGMNKNGIFLELNDEESTGAITRRDRVPNMANLMLFLLDYPTMDGINTGFNTTLPDFACIIQVADKDAAYSYEWATYGLRRKAGSADGLLAVSNDFTDPSWGLWPSPLGESTERRENLYALGDKYKGRLNVDTMKKLLGIPIDKGGATRPKNPKIETLYQMIAVPAELKWWINLTGYQGWTEINLAPLFAKEE
ncbi:MAG: C45 family autoproteolytic acyltransferase/hydrolase [Candidatus Omnitrophica bacterium]|nr:C45 family autoproteolytic acyltransferase/hydrolase [Candidatus Omnitrophota bacterium]